MSKKKILLDIGDSPYGARFWFAKHFIVYPDEKVLPDNEIVENFGSHVIMTPFDSTVTPEAVLHHIQKLNPDKLVALAYSGEKGHCSYCNEHFDLLASGDPLASERDIFCCGKCEYGWETMANAGVFVERLHDFRVALAGLYEAMWNTENFDVDDVFKETEGNFGGMEALEATVKNWHESLPDLMEEVNDSYQERKASRAF